MVGTSSHYFGEGKFWTLTINTRKRGIMHLSIVVKLEDDTFLSEVCAHIPLHKKKKNNGTMGAGDL